MTTLYYSMYHIFIPIKQHSQRVPNKNFKIFKGKKLYQYVLDKYKEQKNVKLCIDTDSLEIQNYCLNNCIDFIKRKKHLIGHKISVVDLIKNYLIEKNIKGDFCQMHITTPYLELSTIKKAYKLLKKYNCVVGCNYIYNRFWIKTNKGYHALNHSPKKLLQTQDLNPVIMENSCFYIMKSDLFLKSNSRICKNPFFYEVKFPQNLDIDTKNDWKIISNVNIK